MKVTVNPSLPIGERSEEIATALGNHQVIVVAGETGSGKTTQLPKLALQTGSTRLAHTQPRRIAARSVARRLADECDVRLGAQVGYAVRFDDRTGPDTALKVMTDGLLLAEIAHDPDLSAYDCIIIDEAHERTLSIDFLLGYLKLLLARRGDLKVIITSATIDVQRFAEMFDAPVFEVSGRSYPVEIRYRAPAAAEQDMAEAISAAIDELPHDGDILIFLSGEREIRDYAEVLRGRDLPRTEVLTLYGRLPTEQQQEIFRSHQERRIILATNVAETSLTVPGIRYVIDTGYARISRYSQRLKVQRLPIEPISQASAAQRAGRCGRVADGICIRLYAQEDFQARPAFTDPEIQRTNLASVLLQMAAQDLGDITSFPFLDPPDPRSVRDGLALLGELGALVSKRDGTQRLTRLGTSMAALALDPRMARIVLAADQHDCLGDVLVIVAALSIQDPRERPPEQAGQADANHARFADPTSDFMSYLALWRYLSEQRRELSGNAFRQMCRAEFLHYLRVREWQDIHAQLRRTAKELGLKPGPPRADPDSVHRALLTGLLSNIGVQETDTKQYLGARGVRFKIFPGSALAKKPPHWVVAGELVQTSRLWARDVARIEPAWIEQAAGPLLKRQYSEPRWSKRRGAAVATERVTLYGVPLVTDRVVQLSHSDPALAHELFIRHALLAGQWHGRHRFWTRNQSLIADSEQVEERVRRRGLRIDEEVLFDFYDARIPDEITSVRHFDSWWKRTRDEQPELLTIDTALLNADIEQLDQNFPTTWRSESAEYEVSYAFDPGTETDGVIIDVPLADLSQLDADEFAWNVPGHRIELVSQLIRSLPKPIRRALVPVSQRAEQLVANLDPAAADPLAELAREIQRCTGLQVGAADFDVDSIPQHLKVVFRVLDDDGLELAHGRDLAQLSQELSGELRRELDQLAASTEQSGLTGWTIGQLSKTVNAGQVTGYPALVDERGSVALRLLDSPIEQQAAMVGGQAKLLSLNLPPTTADLNQRLEPRQKLILATSPYPDLGSLLDDVRLCVLQAQLRHFGPAWNDAEFAALCEQIRPHLAGLCWQALADVTRSLEALGGVQQALRGRPSNEISDDITVQLSWLIYNGFVREVGREALRRIPTYLAAAGRRLANPAAQPADDINDLEAELHELTTPWSTLRRQADDVQKIRWALEELRVSRYAQQLKTPYPVSVTRIRALLDALRQG